MLAVQNYLRKNRWPNDLTDELGIKVYEHPVLPLIGLKYDQIKSPKTNQIVRDCRGIVLEKYSWNVVAKPFRRFFNWGEDIHNCKFDWSDFTTTTKEDGSLMIVYNYNGRWHVNTSGSFGLGECNFSGKSWAQLFWETSGIRQNSMDPSLTYLFEMWTPYNKVLRMYKESFTSLLGAFHNPSLQELPGSVVNSLASELNVPTPQTHHFTSAADITSFLQANAVDDPLFEGVVVRDRNNERLKIKSDTYLANHHLFDNGNILNPKKMVTFALYGTMPMGGDIGDFPQVVEVYDKVKAELDQEYSTLLAIWETCNTIKEQREFAAVATKSKFSHILFNLRKNPKLTLAQAWRDSEELIIKKLYGG
jgi:hypothetical protein